MNCTKLLSFALLMICLIPPTLSVVGNCGSAEVEILQEGPGEILTVLTVRLFNPPFIPPLGFVTASGYWFNELTRRGGPINTPGGRGPFYDRPALVFVDEWIVTTGNGPVVVGFPFITALGPFGFCTGLFPQEREIIGGPDPDIALLKKEVPMNVVKKDDVAFVVDTTGSMSDDIAAVKANINKILDKLDSTSADYRAAVIAYNDPSVSVRSGFSSNRGTVSAAVNSLSASGGGDFPEHVYGGIRAALSLGWRPDAARKIIVLGDAPPKDPEPGTGLTRASILTLANQVKVTVNPSPSTRQLNRTALPMDLTTRQGNGLVEFTVPFPGYIQFNMIPIGSNAQTRSSFEALAEGTRGATFPAATAGDIIAALDQAIETGSSRSGSGSGPVKKLTLTSICWKNSSTHRLRVKNPNDFSVDYDWEVFRKNIKGTGVANKGNNFFEITGISKGSSVTVKLYWKDEAGKRKSTTKALNNNNC